MKKYVIIKADTNDADYVQIRTEIDDSCVDMLRRVVKVIGKKSHNWEIGVYADNPAREKYKDLLSQDDIDWFIDLCPYPENGIHTVVSITIIEVANEEELLNY